MVKSGKERRAISEEEVAAPETELEASYSAVCTENRCKEEVPGFISDLRRSLAAVEMQKGSLTFSSPKTMPVSHARDSYLE